MMAGFNEWWRKNHKEATEAVKPEDVSLFCAWLRTAWLVGSTETLQQINVAEGLEDCPACAGYGVLETTGEHGHRCDQCNGTGQIPRQ
jgi:hypothetical protein